MKNDVISMEAAVTERIGYLQRYKVRNKLLVGITIKYFNS